MAGKKNIDWEAIWMDYRANILSLRDMGAKHGVSEGAIRKKAKERSWERDLNGKIQARAEEMVLRAQCAAEYAAQYAADAEPALVDASARAIVEIKLAHRKYIARARGVSERLLDELELMSGQRSFELLQRVGELMKDTSANRDKLNELYHAILALPNRAKTLKELSEALRVQISMERQAFGMDKEEATKDDGLTSLLHRLAGGSGSAFNPVQDDPEHAQYASTQDGSSAYPVIDQDELDDE